MKVDTKVSQEYTASIFRAKVRQVWKQSGYIGRLRGKWALRSREAERGRFRRRYEHEVESKIL